MASATSCVIALPVCFLQNQSRRSELPPKYVPVTMFDKLAEFEKVEPRQLP
jgi:hypothetical protein